MTTSFKMKRDSFKRWAFSLPTASLLCFEMSSCSRSNNPVSSPTSNGVEIIFTAENHLCVIDADRKALHVLASGPTGSFVNWGAHLSPDGSEAVYAYDDTSYQQIFIVNLTSFATTNLTHDNVFHESPSFSPDGQSVLYLTQDNGFGEDVYSQDLSSEKVTQLTHGMSCFTPSCSPDGSEILFAMNDGADSQGVAIMSGSGTNLRLLSPGWTPQFSENATEILYTDSYSASADGVYIMATDGSDNKFISTIPYQTVPDLSPDGTQIVFSNFVDNNFDIFIMNADGTGLTNLTNTASAEYEPSFSPDGKRIVYVASDTSKDDKLIIMDADGSNKDTLVADMGQLRDPSFAQY